MSKLKYPSLNGLRAVSILFVILGHISIREDVFSSFNKYNWLRPFIAFITDGFLGVNIFFVISGFLITSLMLEEEKETNTVSLKNFYTRRTLRIFPAYYFLLLFYFILQLLGIMHLTPTSWLTSLTYTKYFKPELDWETSHAWSLSIEEQFYLFWPALFICGGSIRKKAAFFLFFMVPVLRLYLHFSPVSWIDEFNILIRIDSIALGCLLALYKERIIAGLTPHWNKLFFISAISLFFLRYLPNVMAKLHLPEAAITASLGSTHGTIANVLIGVLIMYSVFGPRNAWFKFFNYRALSYIGLLSYSLYLWQQFILSAKYSWVTHFPQNLLFLFLMAVISYYFIERPFLKLRDRFQKKVKKTPDKSELMPV